MATLDSRPLKFPPTSEAAISAAIGLAGALFIWVSCVAAFRLFFHPLSSHPGPLLGRLTSLYNTFHILKKDEARNFYHLHERYGPVVRYGPNHISIRTTEAVKKLYTNSTSAKKAPSYLAFPRDPANATLFSTTNKQVHAWKRRVMRRGFSDSALKDAEVVVKKHVSMLLRCLELLEDDDGEGRTIGTSESPPTDLSARGGWGTPKNYSIWINRYSFDLSSDLSVSEPFDMMRKAGNRYIIDLIHENMWAENVTGSAMTLLHKWGLKRTLLGRWVRPFTPFDDFVNRAAEARVSGKGGGTDLERRDFIRWLTADDAGSMTDRAITMDELKEEVILLITAGGDTSSTAISAMLYYLLHNPSKLAKLQAEIRSTFATAEDIRFGSELHSCTYLRACIDEALRMAPPAGSVLRREIEPEGVQIHDFHYPGGTNIGVPVFAIQHDAAYVPDPFSYQPERWIVGEKMNDGTLVTPESVKCASTAFVSFSAGARSCIGRPLAYMSIQILYATMMHKYDVRLCPERWINGTQGGDGPDHTKEYELKDIFTSWKSGPLAELRARA